VRLAALQSVMSIETAELLGYSAPALALLFPAVLRGLSPRCRPPFSCEPGFILSCASPPLQSTDRFAPARTPSRASSTFRGVSFPHRDVSIESPLTDEHPALIFVPPSAFLTLPTVCSSRHLAGLFHPTATSRIHSSGAFPAVRPPRFVTAASPLVVDDSRLQPGCPDCPAPAVSPSGC
jgi:hypothetical protein